MSLSDEVDPVVTIVPFGRVRCYRVSEVLFILFALAEEFWYGDELRLSKLCDFLSLFHSPSRSLIDCVIFLFYSSEFYLLNLLCSL